MYSILLGRAFLHAELIRKEGLGFSLTMPSEQGYVVELHYITQKPESRKDGRQRAVWVRGFMGSMSITAYELVSSTLPRLESPSV